MIYIEFIERKRQGRDNSSVGGWARGITKKGERSK
jgi:hypothetical protein